MLKSISASFAVASVLSVALLAGCSGSSKEQEAPSTRESATATNSTGTDSDDRELAAAILLTVEDFPTGWAEEPDTEDEETPFEECDPGNSEGKTAEAETGDFSAGRGVSISQKVAIFATEGAVESSLQRIDDVADCFIEKLNDGEADDDEVEVSEASFSPLSFPNKGDTSRAFRFKFHVKARGESGFGSEVDVFFDVVYANVGRVGLSVSAFDTFSAPSPDEWEKYLDIAIAKAEAAIR